MIKIEIDDIEEGVEILLDQGGVDELISYLKFIKNNKESMHLVAGNELYEDNQSRNKIIKHLKLIFID